MKSSSSEETVVLAMVEEGTHALTASPSITGVMLLQVSHSLTSIPFLWAWHFPCGTPSSNVGRRLPQHGPRQPMTSLVGRDLD